MTTSKLCLHCATELVSTHPNRKFCCVKCQYAFRNASIKSQLKTDPDFKQNYNKKSAEYRLRYWNKKYGEDSSLSIVEDMARRKRREDPISYMYARTKYRANKKGVEFSISKSDIIIPEDNLCPVLGIPMRVVQGHIGGIHDESYTLDRIDNAKGYIPGNVMVISGRANTIKGKGSVAEHEAILAYMKKYLTN